jgi:hypothetical protein
MSKPYHKLEQAAERAYVLLYKIANGDHKALENAESCAQQLKDTLRMCESENIEKFVSEVGDEQS